MERKYPTGEERYHRWANLGYPDKPGEHKSEYDGIVYITQSDIDTAKAMGGNPLVNLISVLPENPHEDRAEIFWKVSEFITGTPDDQLSYWMCVM